MREQQSPGGSKPGIYQLLISSALQADLCRQLLESPQQCVPVGAEHHRAMPERGPAAQRPARVEHVEVGVGCDVIGDAPGLKREGIKGFGRNRPRHHG